MTTYGPPPTTGPPLTTGPSVSPVVAFQAVYETYKKLDEMQREFDRGGSSTTTGDVIVRRVMTPEERQKAKEIVLHLKRKYDPFTPFADVLTSDPSSSSPNVRKRFRVDPVTSGTEPNSTPPDDDRYPWRRPPNQRQLDRANATFVRMLDESDNEPAKGDVMNPIYISDDDEQSEPPPVLYGPRGTNPRIANEFSNMRHILSLVANTTPIIVPDLQTPNSFEVFEPSSGALRPPTFKETQLVSASSEEF